MYFLPQPYQCPKCGHEANYGPHDPFPAPVFDREERGEAFGVRRIAEPVCPACYERFLREHCGVMQPVKRAQ